MRRIPDPVMVKLAGLVRREIIAGLLKAAFEAATDQLEPQPTPSRRDRSQAYHDNLMRMYEHYINLRRPPEPVFVPGRKIPTPPEPAYYRLLRPIVRPVGLPVYRLWKDIRRGIADRLEEMSYRRYLEQRPRPYDPAQDYYDGIMRAYDHPTTMRTER